MFSYKHHIRDFNNATMHLTRIERSVYRDAIEMFYDTELPLPPDVDYLARKLRCHTQEERTALVTVLDEFFVSSEMGYDHRRCREEVFAYQDKLDAASRAGKASVEKRRQAATEERPFNDRSTTVEPTINHEPRTLTIKSSGDAGLSAERALEMLAPYCRRLTMQTKGMDTLLRANPTEAQLREAIAAALAARKERNDDTPLNPAFVACKLTDAINNGPDAPAAGKPSKRFARTYPNWYRDVKMAQKLARDMQWGDGPAGASQDGFYAWLNAKIAKLDRDAEQQA